MIIDHYRMRYQTAASRTTEEGQGMQSIDDRKSDMSLSRNVENQVN